MPKKPELGTVSHDIHIVNFLEPAGGPVAKKAVRSSRCVQTNYPDYQEAKCNASLRNAGGNPKSRRYFGIIQVRQYAIPVFTFTVA